MKKAYLDYKKYCKEDCCDAFSNKTFGLRLESFVNEVLSVKNKSHKMY
jgi:hypothetical protein